MHRNHILAALAVVSIVIAIIAAPLIHTAVQNAATNHALHNALHDAQPQAQPTEPGTDPANKPAEPGTDPTDEGPKPLTPQSAGPVTYYAYARHDNVAAYGGPSCVPKYDSPHADAIPCDITLFNESPAAQNGSGHPVHTAAPTHFTGKTATHCTASEKANGFTYARGACRAPGD